MTIVKTFWIEPTDKVARYLRRFNSKDALCRLTKGACSARVRVEDETVPAEQSISINDSHPHDDPRWPTHCACGFAFGDGDHWQYYGDRIYRRLDGAAEFPLREAPPGALYEAHWISERGDNYLKGYDGKSIWCVKPHGDVWCIDQRASNCTMKDDDVHRCWVRHGTVGETVHVDKNGHTCAAGAGSIFSGKSNEWHGFLDHGFLTPQRGVYA